MCESLTPIVRKKVLAPFRGPKADLGFVGLGPKQRAKIGIRGGIRTRDLLLRRETRYPLRYTDRLEQCSNTRNNVAQSKGGESSPQLHGANSFLTPWRNGNASDPDPKIGGSIPSGVSIFGFCFGSETPNRQLPITPHLSLPSRKCVEHPGPDEKKSLGCRRDHLRHPQKRAKMAESICSLRQSVKNEPGT